MAARVSDVTSANGTQVTVTEEGRGRAIVIVHPGGGTSSSWTRVARRLAVRFRVVRFDRRPYRIESGVERQGTMAGEVADVLVVAGAVGDPVLLVGHSSGAVVALEAALAAPRLFVGLVLYEPPVAVTKPLGGEALVRANAALEAGDPGQAMQIHLREIVEAPRLAVTLLPLIRPLWRQLTMFAPSQIADDNELESLGVGIDRYAGIETPVLLLGGTRSPRQLRMRLEALAAVLPNVHSVVLLKRQGHLANARAPAKVARIIESFAGTVLI